MTILTDATDVARDVYSIKPADPCVALRLGRVHDTRNFPLDPSMVIRFDRMNRGRVANVCAEKDIKITAALPGTVRDHIIMA